MVIGVKDNKYIVSNRHSPHAKLVNGLPGIIEYMSKLEKKLLEEKPLYSNVKNEEIGMVELVRAFRVKF